ncbi:hypothetical protein IscW_ISCW010289 [Ixodes scapularis]|uniref:FAD dependent oxidoreductase domain-containing protein n=2 Tax=Ixodes scapularis TaxID=6945 RepID=B7Q332_IXOSC|nr:hypothetical protein IscW_ISCW010289 [Ixodes scapularis]|eukprot:XP_002411130.1 hypothetical protein IscW_ISCW010289 [Ixodes scapularis]
MAGRSLLRLPAWPSCRAASSLPQEARVVVCGGGVVGCSVAYHLARDFGVTDVVVLEKDV